MSVLCLQHISAAPKWLLIQIERIVSEWQVFPHQYLNGTGVTVLPMAKWDAACARLKHIITLLLSCLKLLWLVFSTFLFITERWMQFCSVEVSLWIELFWRLRCLGYSNDHSFHPATLAAIALRSLRWLFVMLMNGGSKDSGCCMWYRL